VTLLSLLCVSHRDTQLLYRKRASHDFKETAPHRDSNDTVFLTDMAHREKYVDIARMPWGTTDRTQRVKLSLESALPPLIDGARKYTIVILYIKC